MQEAEARSSRATDASVTIDLNYDKPVHHFIQAIYLRNSINAAINRGRVYAPNVLPPAKSAFRYDCKRYLSDFGISYDVENWDLKRYCQEILSFCRAITQDHSAALTNGILRVGTAQKMISLYLKYLWLSGESAKMPICAVLDRPILTASGYLNPPNWTELNDIKVYECIQQFIDKKASSEGFGSPAAWEAEKWGDIVEGEEHY